MIYVDDKLGKFCLTIVLGVAMLEIGAMPLWVGALIEHYQFDPREAGSLISAYMAGAVVGAVLIVPVFGRLRSAKVIAVTGLAFGSLIFYLLTQTTDYVEMLVLHVCGGLSVGPVIAASQGTVGRSQNPHQLFAITAVAISLVAAMFLAIMPSLVAEAGGAFFFRVISIIFALGFITALLIYPAASPDSAAMKALDKQTKDTPKVSIPGRVWFGFTALICMSAIFTMTMSFVERVGADRGYGLAIVSGVLTVMAIVKLFPAAIAGVLQHKLSPRKVMIIAPIIQAFFSACIFALPFVAVYAIAGPIFIMPMLFAQVFAVGYIAKLEPTGRATAMTPALMMVGSVIGPVLGGTIVKTAGYPSLAIVSISVAFIAVFCFSRMTAEPKEAAIA